LFLHGNPTSSYLWRNIIPYATPLGRAIAPDLIGMGKSDKLNLAYRFHDHYKYLEAFIDKLNLSNITLVIHDWGSGLGFHYAAQHPERIRAISFMEALVRPLNWSDFPSDFKTGFKLMRRPGIGWLMISAANMFVKQILPQAVVRELTEEEKTYYGEPYQTIASRKPVRQWPLEIPIEGKPADMHDIITRYNRWLQQTDMPKLLFYASPGGLIRADLVEWCRQNLPNLTTVDIGPGFHFIQEDNPHLIGEKLADWYRQIPTVTPSPHSAVSESEGASST
ncbi:MAG: haloalkane dehalogenase, partial [Planctomycetes bacterium]|nr:haloalkane dehalogenase [Planctomycetota bacterium]